MQKVKTWYICLTSPPHVRGLGACSKPTGILYLLEESLLAAESCDISIRHVPRAFYSVSTLIVLLYEARCLALLRKNGFRAFHRTKISCEDTQHKQNKLDFSSKNQIK